jgi:hypothetical protein
MCPPLAIGESVDDGDDLARWAAFLDELDGGRYVGQGKAAADHGCHLAGFDELRDLGEGFRGDRGGERLQGLPGEPVEDRGLDDVARRAEPSPLAEPDPRRVVADRCDLSAPPCWEDGSAISLSSSS